VRATAPGTGTDALPTPEIRQRMQLLEMANTQCMYITKHYYDITHSVYHEQQNKVSNHPITEAQVTLPNMCQP
jgi:hypothetical protein